MGNSTKRKKVCGPESAVETTGPLGGNTRKPSLPHGCSRNMAASVALRRQLCSLRRIFSGGTHSV